MAKSGHRVTLGKLARGYRRRYAEVFGHDISLEAMRALHEELVHEYGERKYTLKNLQNWFSTERRKRHRAARSTVACPLADLPLSVRPLSALAMS